jgi:hypothetical protein
MSTPRQEIEGFLAISAADPHAALNVALEFARSMCEELRIILTQWEVEMKALQQAKAVTASAVNN